MTVLIGKRVVHDITHQIRFCYQWDSFYCVTCNIWLETCDCSPDADPKDLVNYCPFETWKRPEFPGEITDWEEARYGETNDNTREKNS